MSAIRQYTLQTKLLVVLAAMLLPAAGLLASSWHSLEGLLRAVDDTVAEVTEEIHPVYRLQTLLPGARAALRDYLLSRSPEGEKTFQETQSAVDRVFDRVRRTAPFSREEEADLLSAAHGEWQAAVAEAQEGQMVASSPAVGASREELARFDARMARIDGDFQTLMRIATEEVEAEHRAVSVATRRMLFHFAAIFVLGLATAALAAGLLRRMILSPIRKLSDGVARLGRGDLGHRTPVLARDELGELAEAFNDMARRLQRSYAELADLSARDALTQLFNHGEFHRRLRSAVALAHARSAPLSLLMLDLDHFKAVNDTLGHQAGDEVIRAVARRLAQHVRPADVIARYGGEEFALLLPATSGEDASAIAQRVAGAISATPVAVRGGQEVRATASVGVATLPDQAADGDDLVAAADQALYRAKAEGRDRVVWTLNPLSALG